MKMMMDKKRKKQLKLSLYGLAYIGLTAVIIFSIVSIFNNYYYKTFYVSGTSMSPTLNQILGRADYGKMDTSSGAKNGLKRFQIVLTYYPEDMQKKEEDRTYKIKRLLVLPGEYYKFEDDQLYIKKNEADAWGDPLVLNYDHHPYDCDSVHASGKMGKNQYFLAGDNGTASYDCFDIAEGAIDYSMLVGVVTAVEGTCLSSGGVIRDLVPYEQPKYFLGVDY